MLLFESEYELPLHPLQWIIIVHAVIPVYFFLVRMFGVYHGRSYFSDTPPVRYKNSSESQTKRRGAIQRARSFFPSAGREKFCMNDPNDEIL